MTLDWNHFTPWASLVGGLMIGAASAAFLLLNGRVLGISGIAGGLIRPRSGDAVWRIAFLAGLVLAPAAYLLLAPAPLLRIDASWGTIAVAGLLVGAGTRFGAGCTSGHGVCGISRLSPRSIVATLCFMAAGMATVAVVRHVLA